MKLRKMVLRLGMAALSVAVASTLLTGPARAEESQAGESSKVAAPAVSQARCGVSSLFESPGQAVGGPALGGQALVSLVPVPSQSEGSLFGTPAPAPVWLSCSGDNCGCFDPSCPEQCDGEPNYNQCVSSCMHGQSRCALCCCCGPCPPYC